MGNLGVTQREPKVHDCKVTFFKKVILLSTTKLGRFESNAGMSFRSLSFLEHERLNVVFCSVSNLMICSSGQIFNIWIESIHSCHDRLTPDWMSFLAVSLASSLDSADRFAVFFCAAVAVLEPGVLTAVGVSTWLASLAGFLS
jgi:hypothetical protein